MKYPLAIVNKLLDVYGADIGLGYNIACAFMTTLAHSSIGKRANELGLRGIVPAFHGYAHHRGCQLSWHPLYIKGTGIEDFEGCERLFSGSNGLAAGTRLASAFHRHQAISQHFEFVSLDKHAELGTLYAPLFLITYQCLL